MIIRSTKVFPEVKIVRSVCHNDFRGTFTEIYSDSKPIWKKPFKQDNLVKNTKKFVLRGLHFSDMPKPAAKLVNCVRGSILDVVVDIRKNSRTFCHWYMHILDESISHAIFVPPGFAHAYLTLTEFSDVLYKTDQVYDPKYERSIRWDDLEINIPWPLEKRLITLSEKDNKATLLHECEYNINVKDCYDETD